MNGYQVVKNLIETKDLYRLCLAIAKICTYADEQCPKSPAAHNHPLMNKLHDDLLQTAEKIFNKKLFKTYAYLRVYPNGEILPKHLDRSACEYSISLCLGYNSQTGWPISIIGLDGQVITIKLEPGDAIFYQGTKCKHWRHRFEGNDQAQVFLHYVDQNGPNAWCKDDLVQQKPEDSKPEAIKPSD